MTTVPTLDQPDPIPQHGVPGAHRLVIKDLDLYPGGSAVVPDVSERERIGLERYGTLLQPRNGRDHLRDAYEEILDAAAYLRVALAERETPDDRVWVMYDRVIRTAIELRGLCER